MSLQTMVHPRSLDNFSKKIIFPLKKDHKQLRGNISPKSTAASCLENTILSRETKSESAQWVGLTPLEMIEHVAGLMDKNLKVSELVETNLGNEVTFLANPSPELPPQSEASKQIARKGVINSSSNPMIAVLKKKLNLSKDGHRSCLGKRNFIEMSEDDTTELNHDKLKIAKQGKKLTKAISKKQFAKYMSNWLRENWTNPYPDDDGLAELSHECGMTPKEVSNWLINARTRKWRPAIIKACDLGRPAEFLKEDAINIFDGKPLHELDSTLMTGLSGSSSNTRAV